MASKTLTLTHVHENPIIIPGRALQSVRAPLARPRPPNNIPARAEDFKQKCDLLIRHMWSKGAYFILDMRVANTNTASYVLKTPEKGLFAAEPGKKS